jgi:hypothetical protein
VKKVELAIIAVLAVVIVVLLRQKQKQQNEEYIKSVLETADFRASLNNIITEYNLVLPTVPGKNLEHEVTAVSLLIAEETVKRTGRDITKLSADESYILLLIGFMAAKQLSKVAGVISSNTTATVCNVLLSHKAPAEITNLTNEVKKDYEMMLNSPDDRKVLRAFCMLADRFFASAEDQYLTKMSELYDLIAENISVGY